MRICINRKEGSKNMIFKIYALAVFHVSSVKTTIPP